MEIEDEEKIEQNDPSIEENNEDEEMSGDEDADEPQARSGGPTPFLDAFYGLSASFAKRSVFVFAN